MLEQSKTMYDAEKHKTILGLIERVGSEKECLRLGFLGRDDNETLFLTSAGMGYLLDVVARDTKTFAEAYAAGYEQGQQSL
jgi:hypothetical protein